MPYETTSVTVSRSQEQIRNVLRHHGAEKFSFAESFTAAEQGRIGVEFVFDNTLVRIWAELELLDDEVVAEKVRRSRSKKSKEDYRQEAAEQEARRLWRVLHWSIKTRMEAIAEGLETFEESFLPHVVDPSTGLTLWQMMHPLVDAGALRIGGTGLKALGAGK